MLKSLLPSVLFATTAFQASAQTDLALTLDNYSANEIFTDDNIELAFTVTNNGPVAYVAGDSIFVSASINGGYFGLDLTGTSTGLELVQDLPVGGTFSFDPGPISGALTLMFFPGATTLDLCIIVWGEGLASVDLTPAFPMDTDPSNNTQCVTFDPAFTGGTDLAVTLDNYTPGEIFSEDNIELAFTITNNGPVGYVTGDSIYLSASINGTYFGLDLTGTSTGLELEQDLPVGGTLNFDPGPISGALTLLFFPGATTLDLCIIVWGEGLASVDLAPAFPMDTDPSNNTQCVTFDPTFTGVSEQDAQIVSVYPNPASDLVTFMTSGRTYDLALNNAAGQVVHATRSTAQERILLNVDGFAPGVYTYSLSNSTGVAQRGRLMVR